MSALLALFDILLTLTLIGLATAALTSREPRRAVILYIAFGLMLALVWARLRAPDLALAEAAIGAGLGGALMLAAARRAVRRNTPPAPPHPAPQHLMSRDPASTDHNPRKRAQEAP
jgi:energy-converting hydrogenase B subunit D